MYQTNNPYSNAIQIYSHPLKSKMIRGKQAPFLNKEIHKLIMQKSRIRNKYNKQPSRKNFLACRKFKDKCITLVVRKSKQKYLKKFWDTVKPFMTNKGTASNDNIVIEAEMKK